MGNYLGKVAVPFGAMILFWILQAVVNRMPNLGLSALAWDFFKTFWPVIGGGMVFLIYWAIQFFRRFKSENEIAFNSWLPDPREEDSELARGA